MKTITHIILGVLLVSLIFSSFSFSGSNKGLRQSETVSFCETFTQEELIAKLDPEDRFFTLIQLNDAYPASSKIGSCHEDNIQNLLSYVRSSSFQQKVPKDLIIATGVESKEQMIPLYAVRKTTSGTTAPTQQEVSEVAISKDGSEENYSLLITFSESGADKWAKMTRSNMGKDIAILFNGKVLMSPRVREEIKNGKCSISGRFTRSEINGLKTVLEN